MADSGQVDELFEEVEEAKPLRKREIRTTDIDIVFENGTAKGWAFDVSQVFQAALDINLTPRVDKERTRAARKLNKKAPAIVRQVWTRGVPSLLSFERGHIFYDPPGPRFMVWSDALHTLKRSVQIKDAAPDGDRDRNGWVQFEICYYEAGQVVRREQHRCSQTKFERFLRRGEL